MTCKPGTAAGDLGVHGAKIFCTFNPFVTTTAEARRLNLNSQTNISTIIRAFKVKKATTFGLHF